MHKRFSTEEAAKRACDVVKDGDALVLDEVGSAGWVAAGSPKASLIYCQVISRRVAQYTAVDFAPLVVLQIWTPDERGAPVIALWRVAEWMSALVGDVPVWHRADPREVPSLDTSAPYLEILAQPKSLPRFLALHRAGSLFQVRMAVVGGNAHLTRRAPT